MGAGAVKALFPVDLNFAGDPHFHQIVVRQETFADGIIPAVRTDSWIVSLNDLNGDVCCLYGAPQAAVTLMGQDAVEAIRPKENRVAASALIGGNADRSVFRLKQLNGLLGTARITFIDV